MNRITSRRVNQKRFVLPQRLDLESGVVTRGGHAPHLAGIAAVARGVQIKPRSLVAQQVGIIVVCRFYELPHRVLVNSLIAPAQPSPFSRFGVVDHLAIAIRRTSGYEEIKLSLRNARHALAIFRHGNLQLLHGL